MMDKPEGGSSRRPQRYRAPRGRGPSTSKTTPFRQPTQSGLGRQHQRNQAKMQHYFHDDGKGTVLGHIECTSSNRGGIHTYKRGKERDFGAQETSGKCEEEQTPHSSAQTLGESLSSGVTEGVNFGAIPKTYGEQYYVKKYSTKERGIQKCRDTVVYTNYFAIEDFNKEEAYQYDVSFEPERPKELFSRALELFRDKHFPDHCLSFDRKRNLYLPQKIPHEVIQDSVNVWYDKKKREITFHIKLKYVSLIDFTSRNQRCMQVLDVVLGSGAAAKSFPSGRIYVPPNFSSRLFIGGGYEVRPGLFLSVKHGERLLVNFDISNKVFARPQPVVNLIKELCFKDHIPSDFSLSNNQLCALKRYLIGMKVDYVLPKTKNLEYVIRSYDIQDICSNPFYCTFKKEDKEITVLDYFQKEKDVPVKYIYLPCLNLGSKARPIYVPVEFCEVSVGQSVTVQKLDSKQKTSMIRNTATSTIERMTAIEQLLEWFLLNDSLQARVFGIKINLNCLQVAARILCPPKLEYQCNTIVVPSLGRWKSGRFFQASKLMKWVILYIDAVVERENVSNFVKRFIQLGKNKGMTINEPCHLQPVALMKMKSEFESLLETYKKFDLIFVIGCSEQFRNKKVYSYVKTMGEIIIKDVLIQSLQSSFVEPHQLDGRIYNLLLKVNMKLGGINNILHQSSTPNKFINSMFVGADVNHPSPGDDRRPSVAAVTASYDDTGCRYVSQIRFQESKLEIIENLEEMMVLHLKYYEKKMKKKPDHLFVYRDGVGDGQFEDVRQKELTSIQQACFEIDKQYKPSITFIIVQKRHHTRFFPKLKDDKVGPKGNVPPGTVVDKCIVQSKEREWYLVSHVSPQGVSRPTKYCTLHDDNKLHIDQLEELTYFLCHLYSRCSKSVSYPAPTYFAHLAALRGSVYLSEIDHKKMKTILKALASLPPMFFC